jgi:hypothetical protein
MKRISGLLALLCGWPLLLGAQTDPVAEPPAAPQTRAAPAPAEPRASDRDPGRSDQLELDASQITGSQELPRVLYIVPWKRSEIGPTGRPANSLLDEVMAPVERTEFRRELNYHNELNREQTP